MSEKRGTSRRATVPARPIAVGTLVAAALGEVLLIVGRRELSPVQSDGAWDALTGAVFALVLITFSVCAILIARRHPRHTLAWLFGFVGFMLAAAFALEGYARIALQGELPAGVFAAWVAYLLVEPALIMLVVYLLLLFPDGKPLSGKWRAVGYLGAIAISLVVIGAAFEPRELIFTLSGGDTPASPNNPFGVGAEDGLLTTIYGVGDILAAVAALLSVASVILRYRGSSTIQRQQLKWLIYAAVMLFLALAITPRLSISIPYVNALIFLLGIVAIPAAATVAIIRYRLYEIDVIINKTLVYGSLAVFVTAVYVAVVVGIGSLIGKPETSNFPLSIAATAVVAVGFQSVRERFQRLANRLVYGRRATPAELMMDLAPRMATTISIDDVLPRMAEFTARGVDAEVAEVRVLLPDGRSYARAWPHDEASDDLDARVDVVHSGEKVGEIGIRKTRGDTLTSADRELLADFAAQTGVALSNVRLTAELRDKLDEISAQTDELRRSRQRIVEASDAARQKIERNLHDGAQQKLVALGLDLQMLETGLPAEHPMRSELERVSEELRAALGELRELARGIHPAVLTEQGLAMALEGLVTRSPVDAELVEAPDRRLPEQVEAAAYYVVAEALTNVARYAEATRTLIHARLDGNDLLVEVSDDGVGGADIGAGSGLIGLRDRVSALGGTMDVESPTGGGTRVIVRLPCA